MCLGECHTHNREIDGVVGGEFSKFLSFNYLLPSGRQAVQPPPASFFLLDAACWMVAGMGRRHAQRCSLLLPVPSLPPPQSCLSSSVLPFFLQTNLLSARYVCLFIWQRACCMCVKEIGLQSDHLRCSFIFAPSQAESAHHHIEEVRRTLIAGRERCVRVCVKGGCAQESLQCVCVQ